jgi:hypothetical protein
MFYVQCSMFDARCSMFDVQESAFDLALKKWLNGCFFES